MTVDHPPGRQGRLDLFEHILAAREDSGDVHHLGQAEDAGPRQECPDLAGPEQSAGVFPRRGGNARRRHEEQVERQPSQADASMSIPRTPSTLPTSCESEITAVVPMGTINRASSAGVKSVLSRCMCASISPGKITRPAAEMVRLARHE